MAIPGMTRTVGACILLAAALSLSAAGTVHPSPFETRFADKPEHAVLVVVDGLSYKVWDRFDLPVMKRMIAGGALAEKNYLPPAAHPHTGAYAELHTCSIPNPIMMAGTVFITRGTGYLQESFAGKTTAFAANTTSYITLNVGYSYSYQKEGRDDDAIRMALEFMKAGKPAFMRVHLQDTGGAGSRSMETGGSEDWRGNIWAPDSPYRTTIQHADSLLGVFLDGLERMGALDRTVIVVMGDHGQSDGGWHPLEIMDSSITSIVLFGAGVKPGVRIPYSEQVDVVPTVCALMGAAPPATSQGRAMVEALSGFKGTPPARPTLIRDLDEQFQKYREGSAEAAWRIERMSSPRRGELFSRLNEARQGFYDIHRFVEWPRFNTVDAILDNNRAAMKKLDDLLADIGKIR
jgi:hypothetical protein